MDDMQTLGPRTAMRHVPGGTFLMGSDRHYRDERPAHKVAVGGFRMDETAVTNADFAAFVATTGYVTVAERPIDPADNPGADPKMLAPGSLVFRMTDGPVDLTDYRNWWAWTPGACWRHPEGPGSDVTGREDHPVIQIAFEDAAAYAAWAGKDLPTEAEWEFAARGGLDGAEFAWGDELTPNGTHLANTWQGPFPWRNFETDGFTGTCPVRSFPANGYGLYEVCGNVWEWATDWFVAKHDPADPAKPSCCAATDLRGPAREASLDPFQPQVRIPRRVVKGGSFLCAPNYCRRYRPAARHAQMVDSGMSHIGFRCIRREPVQTLRDAESARRPIRTSRLGARTPPESALPVVPRLMVQLDGSVGGCLRGLSRWQAVGAVVIARSSVMVGLRKPT